MLIIRFRGFGIDRRIAAAQLDGLLLDLGGYQIFNPFKSFLRMLGVLQNHQRIDEQRAAHLVIASPGNSGYTNFEWKIIRSRQVP
ncbi:hypothetical protein D3C73_1503290 [compost metagenome]